MMWNPEDYAKHSEAQLTWAQKLRANLDLPADATILDVGCGDGKITADFAMALPKGSVVGIDSSAQMIAYATRTYPVDRYPNLSFAEMDARSLEFDHDFDLVFSNATLHWVDNHQLFLQGAFRSLRSSGRLVISCGGQGNAADMMQVFSDVVASNPWKQYFGEFRNPYFFYGDQDYARWLEEAGFLVEYLELVPKDIDRKSVV